MSALMRTATRQRRALTTIRRMVFLVILLAVARPGSAGMLSLDALAAHEGPARDLLQVFLRLAGRDEVARQDLRGDLQQGLHLAEAADLRGREAEDAIAREDAFRPLEDRRRWTFEPEAAREPRYVSPGNPSLSEAARSLQAAL